MQLKDKIYSLKALAEVKFLRKRIPLAVRWQLTNSCPSRCLYCNLWQIPAPEMTTQQIFSILDTLAAMGTKQVSFSGGEPMLREDLGQIIDYTCKLGISSSINTNGFEVPDKIEALKKVGLLKISLDGPREVNNKVRGHESAFDWAILAAEAAFQNKIKFTFCTTLTCYNLDSLGFMVELARKYHTLVAFQPLKEIYRGVKDISGLIPAKEEWQKAIQYRNEWVHGQPPLVKGLGIVYKRGKRWKISEDGKHLSLGLGGGDKPASSVDDLMGFIRPALFALVEAAEKTVRVYTGILRDRGINVSPEPQKRGFGISNGLVR